jgi:hypothetical protein
MQGDQPDLRIFQQSNEIADLFFPPHNWDQLGWKIMRGIANRTALLPSKLYNKLSPKYCSF